jgi:hypothetical protein
MSQKTIRCRLVAPESIRKTIWQLMAERNTPLVNEVLRQLPEHSDFPKWQQRGKLPDLPVKRLIDSLKADSRFCDQLVWYYISAQKQAAYTFRSWLSFQKHKQWRLEGKRRWLDILQPDADLAEKAKCSVESLRSAAGRILKKVDAPDLFKLLLKEYGTSKSAKPQCALAYLLKRDAKLEPEDEDLEKLDQRRSKFVTMDFDRP